MAKIIKSVITTLKNRLWFDLEERILNLLISIRAVVQMDNMINDTLIKSSDRCGVRNVEIPIGENRLVAIFIIRNGRIRIVKAHEFKINKVTSVSKIDIMIVVIR